MKRLISYGWHILTIMFVFTLQSCEETNSDEFSSTDLLPENVIMWSYTTSSITLAWDPVEGATSYTVQLVDSIESTKPIQAYTTSSKDFYQFSGLTETRGYFVRVRANSGYSVGQWVYIMNGDVPGRIMPKYGFVEYDFEEPEPEPSNEPELYPNFPEGFENHNGPSRKSSHTGNGPTGKQSDIFPTGEWLMNNMYTINNAALGHRVGLWSVMMNTNVVAFLEMSFDLPNGARKFSFIYSIPTLTNSSDVDVVNTPVVVTVEYSQDSGTTWHKLEDDLIVSDATIQYFKEYELEIQGSVRFRIGKSASKARLMVDEVAVYF